MTAENTIGLQISEQEWALIDQEIKAIELTQGRIERQEKAIRGKDNHPVLVRWDGGKDANTCVVIVNGEEIAIPDRRNTALDKFFEILYDNQKLLHKYYDIDTVTSTIKYGDADEKTVDVLLGTPQSFT